MTTSGTKKTTAKKKVATKKVATKKVTTQKAAAKSVTKKVTAKKAAPKKAAPKKAAPKAAAKKVSAAKQKKQVFSDNEKRTMVAMHAYYKWEKAGFPGGQDWQHWLEAEKEVEDMIK